MKRPKASLKMSLAEYRYKTIFNNLTEMLSDYIFKKKYNSKNEERIIRKEAKVVLEMIVNSLKNPKPPIGLVPEWYRQEKRLSEIDEACRRYLEVGFKIPSEWIKERDELIDKINEREQGKIDEVIRKINRYEINN